MSHNPFQYHGYDVVQAPVPAFAETCVKLEKVVLFYTTEYRLQIVVNGLVCWETRALSAPPTKQQRADWVVGMIMNCYETMKSLNVDIRKLYRDETGEPLGIII